MARLATAVLLLLTLCLIGRVSAQSDTIYYERTYVPCCECTDIDSLQFTDVKKGGDDYFISKVVYIGTFTFHSWTAIVRVEDITPIRGGFVINRTAENKFPYACLKEL